MSTASSVQMVRCPKYVTNNRILQTQALVKALICGRCKTLLFAITQPIVVIDWN